MQLKIIKIFFSFVYLFRILVTLAIIDEICQVSRIRKYSRMEEGLHQLQRPQEKIEGHRKGKHRGGCLH